MELDTLVLNLFMPKYLVVLRRVSIGDVFDWSEKNCDFWRFGGFFGNFLPRFLKCIKVIKIIFSRTLVYSKIFRLGHFWPLLLRGLFISLRISFTNVFYNLFLVRFHSFSRHNFSFGCNSEPSKPFSIFFHLPKLSMQTLGSIWKKTVLLGHGSVNLLIRVVVAAARLVNILSKFCPINFFCIYNILFPLRFHFHAIATEHRIHILTVSGPSKNSLKFHDIF